MRNKNPKATNSAESVPSHQSFSEAFDQNEQLQTEAGSPRIPTYEFIDSGELARRWDVPVSWIRDQVRKRAEDPLPHVSLGKYVRFLWGSPELQAWIEQRIVVGNNRRVGRVH